MNEKDNGEKMLKCIYSKDKLTNKFITTYKKEGNKYVKLEIPMCLRHQGEYEEKVLQIENEKDPEKNIKIFLSLDKEVKFDKNFRKFGMWFSLCALIFVLIMGLLEILKRLNH